MDVFPDASRLHFGDVTLVPAERVVLREGQPVAMTPKAFDLLMVLAANPGRLLTKERLMQAVWADAAVEESNLSYHVFAIRRALGDTADNGLITTVPKSGYRFTAAVTRSHGGGSEPPTAGNLVGLEHAGPVAEGQPNVAVPPTATPERSRLPSLYATARASWQPAVWFALGILAAGGTALLLWTPTRTESPPLIRAQISPGVQLSEASPFALSPDGHRLVFGGSGSDGVMRLWLQQIGDEAPHPLSGTEAALAALTPPMFWSPDGQTIAFDAGGQLKRFDLRDGATRTVCALPGLAVGGSWNAGGTIIVGAPSGGLLRCPAAGGLASELTRIDPARGETAHLFPWFLPDGRHFLYVRVARKAPEGSGVYIGSLDDAPAAKPPRRLLATGFGAAYIPDKGGRMGHVVFLRDATVFAQAFNSGALQLSGDPIPLATPVGSYLDGAFFSVSENDVIAFRPPDKDYRLTWFDRRGDKIGTMGEVGRYAGLELSPDDSRIATAKEVVGPNPDQDIWILERSRPTSTRVTFGPILEDSPVWSADGHTLMFTVGGDAGNLFAQAVNGEPAPRLLLATKLQHKIPTSASSDGRFLLYTVVNMDHLRRDVWALPLTGERQPFALIQHDFDQGQARFSPDGRLVAYVSNESGRYEVLVRRFVAPPDGTPTESATVAVSTGGGSAPRWRGDSKELYFIAPDGAVMAADVAGGAQLSVGVPHALFNIAGSHGDWDVVSDGSRFVLAMPAGADASAPFTILWNRLAQLRRVPQP